MLILILLIATGLLFLKQGASWFVEGSAGLARKLKVSELSIGLTVVAFGTSAPELVVNVFASFQGNDEIVLGNIIGSNCINLFVILSIAGLITPLTVKSSTAWKEIPFSLFAIVILFLLANDHLVSDRFNSMLGRIDGFIMLLFFSLFIIYVFRSLKQEVTVQNKSYSELANYRIVLFIVAGLAGLIAGGKLVLDNAVKLALELGLSEKIIGLTIVAAGTSLPELATSVMAAIRRNNDIAVGNIIGSNIFNILFILSISSLVKPVRFDPSFNFDIYVLGGGTLLLLIAMFTGKEKRLDRWEALLLLCGYIAYTIIFLA